MPDPAPVVVADAVLAAPARLGAVRVLAVDGPSGSGKSTFAARLATELTGRGARAGVLATDDIATWADPAAWWPRMVTGVLDPLRAGRPGRYRRTEWITGMPRPGGFVDVPVPEVLILEGVTSGRASVRPDLSLLVWIEVTDPVARLSSAVARDGPDCRAELEKWQEFERGWFAVDTPGAAADIRLVGPRPELLTPLVEVVSDTSG